jgi:tRNA (guanine6-N2)-methyltransferase
MNDHLTYYAQTMPGVEKIAWIEIRKRLPRAIFKEYLFAKDKNGIIVFNHKGSPGDLLHLRSVEDVFSVALSADNISRDWGGLRTITGLIEKSESLDQAISVFRRQHKTGQQFTYRVVSREEGQYQYRRKDFEEAVAKGLEKRYGRKWQHVEDNADLEVWANLLGPRLLIGLRLSDRSMRHRAYKMAHLAASLRPSVAAAMAILSEPNPDDVFLDPMCGAGTILAERALAGEYQLMTGGDISFEHARAARENLTAVSKPALVCCWDAQKLPIGSESIDKVVTNPPFGKQIGSRRDIEKLYPRFIAELGRVLKPGGRAVILSSAYELLKETIRQHEKLQILGGYSISILGEWGRIYIVTKL